MVESIAQYMKNYRGREHGALYGAVTTAESTVGA